MRYFWKRAVSNNMNSAIKNADGTTNPDGLLEFAKQCVRLWGPDAARRYLRITNDVFFQRVLKG